MTVGKMKPMCLYCKHLWNRDEIRVPLMCAAFPSGIPTEIWYDLKFDHRYSYTGDNGIVFEKEDGEVLLQTEDRFRNFESVELLDERFKDVLSFYDRGRALGIIDPPNPDVV